MKTKFGKILLHVIRAALLPLLAFTLMFIVTHSMDSSTSFGSVEHVVVMLQQILITTVTAWGMSFNMLSGRWDFSYGGIMALGMILAGNIMQAYNLSPFVMLLLTILICGIFGSISGGVYIVMKVPAIVTSLGMVLIYEMFTNILYGGAGVSLRGIECLMGTFPYVYYISIFFFIVYVVLMNFTKIGYHIRAVGNGQKIAKDIGVKPKNLAIISYVLAGIFMGASICMSVSATGRQAATLKLESAVLMFDAMMCVGVAKFIAKYCDMSLAIFFSVASIKILTSGLLCLGMSSQMQNVCKGIFLLVFIVYSSNQAQLQKKKELKEQARIANENFRGLQKQT